MLFYRHLVVMLKLEVRRYERSVCVHHLLSADSVGKPHMQIIDRFCLALYFSFTGNTILFISRPSPASESFDNRHMIPCRLFQTIFKNES